MLTGEVQVVRVDLETLLTFLVRVSVNINFYCFNKLTKQ